MVDYDLGKVVGDKGETGNGIASITLYSTSGKVKTYRITYTDGSTFDFQVRDGNDASVTVDSSLSSTSVNPVQNKVINSALDGKASSSHSHSIGDVSSLQSSLDGKSDTGHTHTKSNITDFAHTHDDIVILSLILLISLVFHLRVALLLLRILLMGLLVLGLLMRGVIILTLNLRCMLRRVILIQKQK